MALPDLCCETACVIEFGSQYAVGWGTLSLINAGLAQGKDRSGLNWFMLSLLLGPLATLLIVLWGRSEPKAKA